MEGHADFEKEEGEDDEKLVEPGPPGLAQWRDGAEVIVKKPLAQGAGIVELMHGFVVDYE